MEDGKEPKSKKEAASKKRAAAKAAGIAVMFVGIAVAVYPLCIQGYHAYLQKKMVEEIRAEISENQSKREAGKVLDSENEEEEQAKPSKEAKPDGEDALTKEGRSDEEAEPPKAGAKDEGEPLAEEGPDEEDGRIEEVPSGEEETLPQDRPNRLSGRTVIGLIEIEAIALFYPIVEGVEAEDIGVAIGHMSGTAKLGAIGNCVLAGHRGGYSGPYFKKLDQLKTGDLVVITNDRGTEFTYEVTEQMTVEPTDVWVAEDTGEDKAMLTLITCEENGEKRLIVRCAICQEKE